MNKTLVTTMFALGGAGIGFILYKSYQNKEADSESFVKPPPGVKLPEGTISPGLPQMEIYSQSIDGQRSPYLPPPGKTALGRVASNVSRIRAEGRAYGARVDAFKKAAAALPAHRKPDGSELRTAGPMQCAKLIAAGKFDEARASGCN